MTKLQLAPKLALPFDAVTETFGWIGNRGSGKTYAAKRMAEVMLRAGAQVVVLDPVDAWYGLRYGRSKGESGMPVYVFGGEHGDLPLEAESGALIADVVVETSVSVVLSLRHLPKGAQRRFVRDFCAQLYLRKGENKYRTPVHVFIEEAHTFVPQTMTKEAFVSECLGAVQDLVLQGRSSGIGVSLITQRVAAVAKSVLELAEVMCAFRTTGPNARTALSTWFKAQDGEDHLNDFLAAIVGLPKGDGWLWSPGYLNRFEPLRVSEAETFDSSATPKAGQRRSRPRGKAAQLDLNALGERIAETRERQEQDDPKRLHAEIDRLKAELDAARSAPVEPSIEYVDRPVMPPDLVQRLGIAFGAAFSDVSLAIDSAVNVARAEFTRELDSIADSYETAAPAAAPPPPALVQRSATIETDEQPIAVPRARRDPDAGDGRLDKAMRAVLTVLAQHGTRTHDQLALQTGYSAGASTVGVAISRLRAAGYVTPESTRAAATITAEGRSVLGSFEPLPSGPDLLAWWRTKLGEGAQRRVMEALLAAYPADLAHDAICDATEYARTASTVGVAISRLRTLGIADGNRAAARLSEAFAQSIQKR